MGAAASPGRLSLLVGVGVLMLATLPRYLVGGQETRLTLLSIALGVVALVAAGQWWLLSREARVALPDLLGRLAVALGVGLMGMGVWHALFGDGFIWQLWLSHGATLGLLLHALRLWWQPR